MKLTAIEKQAAIEAGRFAGSYLDHIGKTDLSTMTDQEWQTFCLAFAESFCVHCIPVGTELVE